MTLDPNSPNDQIDLPRSRLKLIRRDGKRFLVARIRSTQRLRDSERFNGLVRDNFFHIESISNAVGYAKFFSRSYDAVIRVYDECAEKL